MQISDYVKEKASIFYYENKLHKFGDILYDIDANNKICFIIKPYENIDKNIIYKKTSLDKGFLLTEQNNNIVVHIYE